MHFFEFYLTILFSIISKNVVFSDPIDTAGPSVIIEGKDALLTCVVMGPYSNYTVTWRRIQKHKEVLTAGLVRVTNDKRITVLHDDSGGKAPTGGDVWVLLIKDVRVSDTDVYVCEINTEPMLRSLHPLKVRSAKYSTPLKSTKLPVDVALTTNSTISTTVLPDATPVIEMDDSETEDIPAMPPSITHDFTDCCQSLNISSKCMGFCTVHNILDGTTGIEPEACEHDFPSIVKCMADGRNHLPCCERKKIPDLCQDMCRGEYSPYTDFVKSRVSCIAHTLPALVCILEGVQILPSEPLNVIVEPINERSIQVSWSPPEKLASTVTDYFINVTVLQSFDQDHLANINESQIGVSVKSDQDSILINNLKPFTMYTITVTAQNEYGTSLPSSRIRALTLDNGGNTQTSVAVVPVLPDVRSCCMKNGITHRTCLDRMCDPKEADFTEIPDLMVCAPWANISFKCLANNIDHTPCCLSRGIPEECLSFCAGNVTTITFSLFKCLQYMSDYSNCLLQGYGVLPGPPSRLKATLIAPHFAVLEWNLPKILPDTVTSYHVYMRELGSGDVYTYIEKDRSPLILEGLDAGKHYEAFVVAVNAHGKGGPSPRLVFQTKHEIASDPPKNNYNMTLCCLASGLLPMCMPLCTYDSRMSDIQKLGTSCRSQMGVLARCAAGGRDHTPCCNRRGVPSKCISLCHGVVPQPPVDCIAFGGNMIQCFEEGTDNIPGPVEDLHATSVTNNTISLAWLPFHEGKNNTGPNKYSDFLIQYGKVNNMTMYETIVKLENEINTTETEIELNHLDSNSLYRILVVARGEYGSSLPSSMLLINTSNHVTQPLGIFGVPSPPHSLLITAHSATMVNIAWQPPEFSHPHEIINYVIHHKSTSADGFTIIETRLLWARLANLKPNSQHVVYVVAIGSNGESLPSETLVAWTDPALPPFVDPPTITPSNILMEGGSMNVLCVALGDPTPTISLYAGGHLVRQDTSRHMYTLLNNITTDMEHVSCYADNGYGIPMQASKRVDISFKPRIQVPGITMTLLGERVDLSCIVRAKPAPKIIFWRDHEGRVPVIMGKNLVIKSEINSEDPSATTVTLSILRLTNEFVGDYFCHAENPLGFETRAVSVRIRNIPAVHNVSECCVAQNVSSACMDACSFYIDIEAVKDRTECIVDFDKLMKCAADGSDHRSCCAEADVPRSCLNWCRGEPVPIRGPCIFQHTQTIIDCFQSNRDRLPGPPLNLHATIVSDDSAVISWMPPLKNPQVVEGYQLYWYNVETHVTPYNKSHESMNTKDLKVRLNNLHSDVVYELVMKAANEYGASVLTEPIRFTLGDNVITSASHSNMAGTVCGILAGMFAIAITVVVLLFYKRRRCRKSANGVAFENPSYLREVNMEHVQISPVTAETTTNWRQERLQPPPTVSAVTSDHMNNVPMATEVNPSLYEELKLGHEGAGFKRLVS